MNTEEFFPGTFHPSGSVKSSPLDTSQKKVSSVDNQSLKPEVAAINSGEFVFPKDGLKIGSLDTQEKDLKDVLSCIEHYVKAIKEIKKISEAMEQFNLTREDNFRKNFAAERSDYDEKGAKEYLRRQDERRLFLIGEVQKVRDLFGCEDGFKDAIHLLQKIKKTEDELSRAKGNIDQYDDLVVERQRLVDDFRDLLEIYGGFSQSDLPLMTDIFDKIKLLKAENSSKINEERLKKLLLLLPDIKKSLREIGIYEKAIAELDRMIAAGERGFYNNLGQKLKDMEEKNISDKRRLEAGRASLVEQVQKLLEESKQI